MLGITAGEICPRKSCSINGGLRSCIKNCPLSRDVLVNVNLLLLWKMSTIFVLNTRCARVPSVSSVCNNTWSDDTDVVVCIFFPLFFFECFPFFSFSSFPNRCIQDRIISSSRWYLQCRYHFESSRSCTKEYTFRDAIQLKPDATKEWWRKGTIGHSRSAGLKVLLLLLEVCVLLFKKEYIEYRREGCWAGGMPACC